MVRSNVIVLVVSALSASLVLACEVADIEGGGLKGEPGDPKPASKPATCTKAGEGLTAQDPSSLPACACASGGKARCVAKGKVPGALGAQLESCDEGGPGVCVPDELVKTGGGAPKTCTSPFGEGRCMSLCVPEVAKNAKLLDRGEGDACAEEERCAPCKNPLKGGEATGVCEIGSAPAEECKEESSPSGSSSGGPAPAGACPYEGPPLLDVTTFPACGEKARCVPAATVPASVASMLEACPTGLCVPEKQLAAGGNYLPKTCVSVAGAEGRCLNVSIGAVKAQKDILPRESCDAEERCAPCFSPTDGKPTGACSTVSCDKPKGAGGGAAFKDCCRLDDGKTHGKCVPKTLVPAASLDKLGDDDGTCNEATEVCAPTENLDPTYKPAACTGSSLLLGSYTGVCVSECVEFGIQGLALSKGSCTNVQKCAPCVAFGKPSGAPGCP